MLLASRGTIRCAARLRISFRSFPPAASFLFWPPTGTVSPAARIRPDKLIAPTLDAWNATVQRQLTNKTSLEIAYVGNHGTHVFKGNSNTYNANQATVVGFSPCNRQGGVSYNARSPYNTAFTTSYTDRNGVTSASFVALDRDLITTATMAPTRTKP